MKFHLENQAQNDKDEEIGKEMDGRNSKTTIQKAIRVDDGKGISETRALSEAKFKLTNLNCVEEFNDYSIFRHDIKQ